jgi:hypothetical protein
MCKKLVFLAMLVAMVSPALAVPIVYIDANEASGNTIAVSGLSPWSVYNTSYADGTGTWQYRYGAWGLNSSDTTQPATPTTVVAGGGIYQSIGSNQTGMNAATLRTRITGLDNTKTYNIYVYFWEDQNNSPWSIRAALTEAGLLGIGGQFQSGPQAIGPIQTPVAVGKDSSGRLMWRGVVGVISGKTSQNVFIDDLPTDQSNNRTWYDGVGYEALPEPATLALLGLGSLALLRRKK